MIGVRIYGYLMHIKLLHHLYYFPIPSIQSHEYPQNVKHFLMPDYLSVGQAYSFIMFACFSKKKKQKPAPPPIQSSSSNVPSLTDQSQPPAPLPYSLPPHKPIKKSKFCPIEPEDHPPPPPEFKSASLSAIDHMLEQELGEPSAPYAQENTACFGEIPEPIPKQAQTSRFALIVEPESSSEDCKNMKFKDTKSLNFDAGSFIEEDSEYHFIPKNTVDEFHTIEELTDQPTSGRVRKKPKRSSKHASIKPAIEEQQPQFPMEDFRGYDATGEQWALDTTISLENFKITCGKIHRKIEEELEDNQLMGETLEEAQNSFYCSGTLNQEFTRAVTSSDTPQLPKRIFNRMNRQQKNAINSKGYTPVQLLVMKTISNESFLQLAKSVVYDGQVSLSCKGPTGWTPLQQALFYRNIPLVTHLFKASYSKKQQEFHHTLRQFSLVLQGLPDFEMEIEVKVDSFLPLVGNLTPNDTLKIIKRGDRLRLKYSLVGYQFPSCKRRDMQILFSGGNLWGVNNSKHIYCNLLQQLEHQEMILMIEDMLTGEMKRGWPIVHSVSINKALSLFQNEIVQQIAGSQACKHILQLCYTSTAEKRRSQIKPKEEFAFLNSYSAFKEKRESMTIKEKNKNKKVELQLWLAKDFGLQVGQLVHILQILSMGNSFIAEWSKFFKDQVGALIQQSGQFPVKIDIPLNYSLFFNIEFQSFRAIPQLETKDISIPKGTSQVSRRQFQGTLLSKQKRALFIQAYT